MARNSIITSSVATPLNSGGEFDHDVITQTVAPNSTLIALQVKSSGLTATGAPAYRIRLYNTLPTASNAAFAVASYDVNLDADAKLADLNLTNLGLPFSNAMYITYDLLQVTLGGTTTLEITSTFFIE